MSVVGMQEFNIELEALNKQLSTLAAQNKRRTLESARVQCRIGRLYKDNDKFDSAIESCGKCIDIVDDISSALVEKNRLLIDVFFVWAQALIGNHKFAEAQTKGYQAVLLQLEIDRKDTIGLCQVLKDLITVVDSAGLTNVASKLRSGVEAIQKELTNGQHDDNLIAELLCDICLEQIAPNAPPFVEDVFRFLIRYCKDVYPAGDMRPTRCMQGLGDQLRNDKKFEDAKYVLSEALSLRREYHAEGRVEGLVVAVSANSLGLCYRGLGRFEEAEMHLMEALTLRKERMSDHAALVAGSLNNLAELFRDKGNIGQSIMFHESAIATFEGCLGAQHPSTVNARGNLGITLSHNARMGTEAGLNMVQHAMTFLEGNGYASDHPWVIKFKTELLMNEAEKHVSQEEYAEALDIYESVIQMNPFCKESDVSIVILRKNWQARYRKAEKLCADAHYEEAKLLFKECMDDSLSLYDPNDPLMCEVTFSQAENLRLKGEVDEARELYEVLLKIRSGQLGDGHPLCARLMNALGVIAMEAEKYSEAKPLFEQVKSWNWVHLYYVLTFFCIGRHS